jgi:hypothetical protein
VLSNTECSGIHRSLGTHVSKIRSLTLDSTSYTPDIIELLKSIGNARSNAIWDSRFELGSNADLNNIAARPNPTDSRAAKLTYIQAKYVGRSFGKKSDEDPDKILFEAIDHDDIPKALYALVSGANVNSSRPDFTKSPRISLFIGSPQQQQNSASSAPMKMFMPFLMDLEEDKSRDATSSSTKFEVVSTEKNYIVRYALHYALLHGREMSNEDVFNNNSSTSPVLSSSSTTTDEEEHHQPARKSPSVIFPMAEFLLQNGADTGIVDPQTGHTLAELVGMGTVVDDNAIAYINLKNTARGQSTIVRSNTITNPPQQHEEIVAEEESTINTTTNNNDIPPLPLPKKDSLAN